MNKYNIGDILFYERNDCSSFHILIEDCIKGDALTEDEKCWGIDVYKVRIIEDDDVAAVEQSRIDTNPYYTKVA